MLTDAPFIAQLPVGVMAHPAGTYFSGAADLSPSTFSADRPSHLIRASADKLPSPAFSTDVPSRAVTELGNEVLGLMSGALVDPCSTRVMRYVRCVLDTAIPRIPFAYDVDVCLSEKPTEQATGAFLPLEIKRDLAGGGSEIVLGFILFMNAVDTDAARNEITTSGRYYCGFLTNGPAGESQLFRALYGRSGIEAITITKKETPPLQEERYGVITSLFTFFDVCRTLSPSQLID